MSVSYGIIKRHEDVHGISGEGKVAEVFEASDGTAVVIWLGPNGSTNVYRSIKNVMNVHSHGGKTDIEWIWREAPESDPMRAVFDRVIADAKIPVPGGSMPEDAEKDAEAEATADEIVNEAEEAVDRVAVKVAEKLKERATEKVAQKAAEAAKGEVEDENAEK